MNMKRIKESMNFAKSLIRPDFPLYNIQRSLKVLANLPTDFAILPMYHVFHQCHLVTIRQAMLMLDADYRKHPSKARLYQYEDLDTMKDHVSDSIFRFDYVRDPSPMSVYPRLQISPAEYPDVLNVIDYVKHGIRIHSQQVAHRKFVLSEQKKQDTEWQNMSEDDRKTIAEWSQAPAQKSVTVPF